MRDVHSAPFFFLSTHQSHCRYLRKQLTTQVARLEAQLTRAGQSVQQERAEMESVLYRLSSALAGVDEELMQSAVSSDETNVLLATTRKRGWP